MPNISPTEEAHKFDSIPVPDIIEANAESLIAQNEILKAKLFKTQEELARTFSAVRLQNEVKLSLDKIAANDLSAGEQVLVAHLLQVQDQIEAYHNFCDDLVSALLRSEKLLLRARSLIERQM